MYNARFWNAWKYIKNNSTYGYHPITYDPIFNPETDYLIEDIFTSLDEYFDETIEEISFNDLKNMGQLFDKILKIKLKYLISSTSEEVILINKLDWLMKLFYSSNRNSIRRQDKKEGIKKDFKMYIDKNLHIQIEGHKIHKDTKIWDNIMNTGCIQNENDFLNYLSHIKQKSIIKKNIN